MTQFDFKRRKNYRSSTILLSLLVVILLLVFIPQMLLQRTRSIINQKLDLANSDTTYVRLVQAAESYMQTADAFVIFRSQSDELREELKQKMVDYFYARCKQESAEDAEEFCKTWSKVIPQIELKNCDKCAAY